MATTFNSHTKRAEPFHTQNAPYSFQLSTLPLYGRLYINPEACLKKQRRSLILEQRIWLNTKQGRKTLTVFTDGSKLATPRAGPLGASTQAASSSPPKSLLLRGHPTTTPK